jgi:hypothetical protein
MGSRIPAYETCAPGPTPRSGATSSGDRGSFQGARSSCNAVSMGLSASSRKRPGCWERNGSSRASGKADWLAPRSRCVFAPASPATYNA